MSNQSDDGPRQPGRRRKLLPFRAGRSRREGGQGIVEFALCLPLMLLLLLGTLDFG
jgi:Flp pilus assembly protein TadG